MPSVLIVDDEEPVLDSYAFMLEQDSEHFTLAGKGRSGFEAIQLIHELKPDVVLMDINMPGLDGLEVIEQIHGKYPSTLFILSTAYERFDLARRAIPLGIFAYLVKPVSRRQFTETLADAYAELRKRAASKPAIDQGLLARGLLREAVWTPLDTAAWAGFREGLGFDSNSALIFFVLIDSDDQTRYETFAERVSLRYRVLHERYLDLGMFLVSGDVDVADLESDIAAALAQAVPQGVLAFAGLGPVCRGTELNESCATALAAIRKKKSHTDAGVRERFDMMRIRRGLGIEDEESLRTAFTAWWKSVFSTCDFELAKAKMVALFSLLIADCLDGHLSGGAATPLFDPAEEITALKTTTEWERWAGSAFTLLYAQNRMRRAGTYPPPLLRALEFIKRSFATPVALADAASAAGVSAAYLSRLFSEHMGTSFVDYLTELRMEEAERLIRSGALSVKEISFAVGYQDPNYFSKIFRKSAGVSPSMYAERERYGENKAADRN